MLRVKSRLIAGVVMIAMSSACASSTLIKSSPSGAKVYIDGSLVGRTPYTMTDTKIVGATTSVQLKLEGYEDFAGTITRSEEFSPGACLGGVLVLVPFLWIQGYKPERTFELTPLRYPASQGYPNAPVAPQAPYPAYPQAPPQDQSYQQAPPQYPQAPSRK